MEGAAAPVVLPTPFPVGPVNCWVLRSEPLTLIDAGPNTPQALDALERRLAGLGLRLEQVELLLLTHQHSDHVGLARVVKERSGCVVAAHKLLAPYLLDVHASLAAEDAYEDDVMRLHGTPDERREAFLAIARERRAYTASVVVDAPLEEGDVVQAGGRRLAVSLRPGHSPSDTVFVDEAAREAFVGDHLLAHISSNPLVHRPLAGPADPRRRRSSLAAYLDSLARTAREELAVLHTGHGKRISDHRPLIAERTRFHRDRMRLVLEELREGARSAGEISRSLWPEIPVSQTYLALSEVLGALDVLEGEGRVRPHEDAGYVSYELAGRL